MKFSKNEYDLSHLSLTNFDWIDWKKLDILTDWKLLIWEVIFLVSNPILLKDNPAQIRLRPNIHHFLKKWSKNMIFQFLYVEFCKVLVKGIHKCKYLERLPFKQLRNIFYLGELLLNRFLLYLWSKTVSYLS